MKARWHMGRQPLVVLVCWASANETCFSGGSATRFLPAPLLKAGAGQTAGNAITAPGSTGSPVARPLMGPMKYTARSTHLQALPAPRKGPGVWFVAETSPVAGTQATGPGRTGQAAGATRPQPTLLSNFIRFPL